MKKRAVILAKGRVQRVGYRDGVEEIARQLEIGEESVSIGKKMLDKQDMMLDKQDDTIGEIRGLRRVWFGIGEIR